MNSPPPLARPNDGVRGALDEDVPVLPLVIKLGVESVLPPQSLCDGILATAISISCAVSRRNMGTDDRPSRSRPEPEPDRIPEDAGVVGSQRTGDAGTRVLWLPCVMVRMLVEVLSVPLSVAFSFRSAC